MKHFGGLLSAVQPASSFILRFMPSLPLHLTSSTLSWFLVHKSCSGRATSAIFSSLSALGRSTFSQS